MNITLILLCQISVLVADLLQIAESMKLFEPPQLEGWKILICVTHTYAIFVISSPEFPVISRSTLGTCAYKNVEIGLTVQKNI